MTSFAVAAEFRKLHHGIWQNIPRGGGNCGPHASPTHFLLHKPLANRTHETSLA